MFETISDAHLLRFNHLFGLLDLDIEVSRQRRERLRLQEEFDNPHPNTVLGQKSSAWFTQMVMERLAPDHYHCTFVPTERWIQVRLFLQDSLFLLFSSFFLQSLDDAPPKNPWDTTERLSSGFISEYFAEYEFGSRSSQYPPAASIEKAYAAAVVADDPGVYNSDGEEFSAADQDYHYELAEGDALNDLVSLVTSVDYQMPFRTRCRIPSGPYRVITSEERDLIAT